MVASYAGTSPYLIAVNYNNCPGVGTGDGVNRLAVLEPAGHARGADHRRPTFESGSSGPVFEWCRLFSVDR